MVFNVREVTIEGEPQEMAEFVLAIERLQSEEAMKVMRESFKEQVEEESLEDLFAELFEDDEEEEEGDEAIEPSDIVVTDAGETMFVVNVSGDDAYLSNLGEGLKIEKVLKVSELRRLPGSEEESVHE